MPTEDNDIYTTSGRSGTVDGLGGLDTLVTDWRWVYESSTTDASITIDNTGLLANFSNASYNFDYLPPATTFQAVNFERYDIHVSAVFINVDASALDIDVTFRFSDPESGWRPTTVMLLGSSGVNSVYFNSKGILNIEGSEGDYTIIGDGKDSIFVGLTESDTIDGGAGTDTVSYHVPDSTIGIMYKEDMFPDHWISIERIDVTLSDHNDTVIASDGISGVDGGDGLDTLQLDLSKADAGARISIFSYNVNTAGSPSVIQYSGANFGNTIALQYVEGIDVNGSGFDDRIYAYDSNADHTLRGGIGSDEIYGGRGVDSVYGGAGNDSIGVCGLDDVVYGGKGNDNLSIYFEPSEVGADLNASILGNRFFGIESYFITMTSGDDVFVADSTPTAVFGSDGVDTIVIDYSLKASCYYENFEKSRISGTSESDNFGGQTPNDRLWGMAGDDTLSGGGGADSLFGGTGNDFLIGGAGNFSAWGGSGGDVFQFTTFRDTIYGGAGVDIVELASSSTRGLVAIDLRTLDWFGIDGIFCQLANGNNTVYADNLIAGEIKSGRGTDLLVLDYTAGQLLGIESVALFNGVIRVTLDRRTAENTLKVEDFDILKIRGSIGNDSLSAYRGNGNDTLNGFHGNDKLQGLAGRDVLFGSLGKDVLLGGDDADQLFGGSGQDFLNGQRHNDLLTGGANRDYFLFEGLKSSGNDRVLDYRSEDIIWVGGDLTDEAVAIRNMKNGTLLSWETGSILLVGYQGRIDLRFNEDFDQQNAAYFLSE
jgi:Ca2+-binding RTX toxin-like protein